MRSNADKIAECLSFVKHWARTRHVDVDDVIARNYVAGVRHDDVSDLLALMRAINRLPLLPPEPAPAPTPPTPDWNPLDPVTDWNWAAEAAKCLDHANATEAGDRSYGVAIVARSQVYATLEQARWLRKIATKDSS